MRIAFLDSWLQNSAEGSGTAVAIGGLQHALQRKGVQVTRIAPTGRRFNNLMVERLLFNMQLPLLLRNHSYDLVVGFDIDGFLWNRRSNTPYLVSVKGVLAEEARQERGRIRAMLWSLSRMERRNVRHAQGVLTTSAYCQRAIAHHYGVPSAKIGLVPEGIDLAHWQRIAQTTPNERSGTTILCVARQYPRKHVADLLRAMVLVRRAVPNARAIVIGDGPEHAALQQLAVQLDLGSSVQLLGAVADDDEVVRAYQRADIFCLPSVQEGFGIAFLEAMASGLPIVTTTATAIPETVPDGKAGVLVGPSDVVALSEALIELLSDPRRRSMLGDFGREHVLRYDWNAVADIFLGAVQGYLRQQPLPAPSINTSYEEASDLGTSG
jgi:glycosyltransferase involved in cell wall biosynthesis